jgi:hypothetical protein
MRNFLSQLTIGYKLRLKSRDGISTFIIQSIDGNIITLKSTSPLVQGYYKIKFEGNKGILI